MLCVTVNYKVQISDSAVLIVTKKEIVTEVLINPINRTRSRHFRHAYHLHEKILSLIETVNNEPEIRESLTYARTISAKSVEDFI
jgi:hypothetical protein